MKTEEIKKQDELNDEQLDNVAGAGEVEDLIKEIKEFKERAKDVS
jgi:hypothetical protein